ncbi:MAG: hypothetical protein JW778_05975 [Candidatus Altiarchaeota archaeon]|nr:hypothetical protein [Candidatus Altiarchaeota archaeon]
MKTPDLKPRKMSLSIEYVNKLLGMDYSGEEVKKLLEKMRYGVEVSGEKIKVLIPAYRTDVLHPMDLVEDIAIAHGYGNFKPELPKTSTIGERDPAELFYNSIRELMLGFGFQETMTLIMTNKKNLFEKMETPEEKTVETKNPVSVEHSIARTWLLPSLLTVLEKNKNREYPQRIFEIGYCITGEGRDKVKMAAVIAHSKANFSETKAIYTGIMDNIGIECKTTEYKHGSFIPGRCASTEEGFFGEIHPKVLENFGLEVPVTAFELDLSSIFERI